MGDFRKSGGERFGGQRGGFGRRDGGRGGFGGGRDRGPVTMHQAVCDQCKKPCEVPFMPTTGKPVYCNDCFGGRRDAGSKRGEDRFPQRSYDGYKAPVKSDFGNNDELKKQLEMLNGKMDRLVRAVESMANIKPLVAEKEEKKAVKTVPAARAKKSVKKVSKK